MMFLGTSLTAGYGLDPSVAYPEVIQRMVDSAGYRYRVVNAGVSGETSAGALRRTEWLFQQAPPAIFILETGGNDGLRGLEPDSLEANVLALPGARVPPRPATPSRAGGDGGAAQSGSVLHRPLSGRLPERRQPNGSYSDPLPSGRRGRRGFPKPARRDPSDGGRPCAGSADGVGGAGAAARGAAGGVRSQP